ncbi:hypothetical protein ACES2J_08275 [Bdellovibrio bacteriovorus]|uniref:hypothetical protein n=1 Tax=Bdellovibrio bacteriovorus TaxID=959 RepID=UPI0035A6380B
MTLTQLKLTEINLNNKSILANVEIVKSVNASGLTDVSIKVSALNLHGIYKLNNAIEASLNIDALVEIAKEDLLKQMKTTFEALSHILK